MLTVSCLTNTTKTVTLYNTLKSFTFRGTGNINELAFFKHFDSYTVT